MIENILLFNILIISVMDSSTLKIKIIQIDLTRDTEILGKMVFF